MELKSKRESAESPDVSPPLVYCALLRCESSINAKKGRATHLDGSYNIHHNTIVSAFPLLLSTAVHKGILRCLLVLMIGW